MNNEDFKIGSRVALKHGANGNFMTVVNLPSEDNLIQCAYFNGDKLEFIYLPIDALGLYE